MKTCSRCHAYPYKDGPCFASDCPQPESPMLTEAVWEIDEYACWNLRFMHGGQLVHAHIQTRPKYCDRGHWVFNVDGVAALDAADSFPRYYMDLNAAMTEATDWLNWRLFKVPYGQTPASVSRDFRKLDLGTEKVR